MKVIKKVTYYVFMIFLLAVFLLPFLLVLLNSLKDNKAIIMDALALPKQLYLDSYAYAFDKMNFLKSFGNSLYVTAISIVFIILISSMCAYFFARNKWKINKILFTIMVASMIIPFQAIMIPLVRNFSSLNMMNNLNAVVLFYIGANVAMAVFMFHGFVSGIPYELEEAATIDGCGRFGVFFRIVFPLLKPIISTITILDILAIWNDFLLPFILLQKESLRTLPLTTYSFVGQYTVNYSVISAALVLSIIPIIIVYLFLQKYIIDGVVQGAIK